MRLALAPICDRIRSVARLHNVEGVLEFAATTVEPRALPAAWVVPVAEAPRGNANDVGRDQAVDVTFSVMLALAGARRAAGRISEELQAETSKVVDALTGWTHPDASAACSYAGGRLASADGSTLVWDLRFTTRYHLRKAS